MSDPIDELKAIVQHIEDMGDCPSIQTRATLAIASRIADLERTVAAYKEAVDMVTAWADGRDREAYEKAIKEIPDKPDRAEIVERYAKRIHKSPILSLLFPSQQIRFKEVLVEAINDLLDEVTHERP